MHDIGKIGTPDHVLLKPGKFTQEEFDVISQHAEIGYRILSGSDAELLKVAAVIAWTHHEKFDGNGYPRGLKGRSDSRLKAGSPRLPMPSMPSPHSVCTSPPLNSPCH